MRKKNIITGTVVIIALVLLFLGFNFLNSNNLFLKGNTYCALYDKVDGLEKSSIVMIRGYKVGTVVDVHFKDETARQLVVVFTVDDDYKIPKNTVARIVNKDIMGSRSLALVFPEKVKGYINPGDTLVSALSKGLKEEVSAQVLPLKAKVEEIMTSMDTLLTSAKTVLGQGSQRNLVSSIESMRKTFKNLERTTGSLDNIISSEKNTLKNILQDFSGIAENLNNNKDNVNAILSNISSLTDTLAGAGFANTLLEMQNAMKKLSGMVAKIDDGEGSIGALLHDDGLYDKLESAASNMDRLLTDVRLNPKKYVSFSLLKTGRTIYYDTEAKQDSQSLTNYRIQILSTTVPITMDNPVFKNYSNVTKQEVKEGEYRYTIGYTTDYDKLNKLLRKVRKYFPDAYIIED